VRLELAVLLLDHMEKQIVLQPNQTRLDNIPQKMQPLHHRSLIQPAPKLPLRLVERLPLGIHQPHTLPELQHKGQYLHILHEVEVAEVGFEDVGQAAEFEAHFHLQALLEQVDFAAELEGFVAEVEGRLEEEDGVLRLQPVAEVRQLEVGVVVDGLLQQLADEVAFGA
jgi:hypothetical protein